MTPARAGEGQADVAILHIVADRLEVEVLGVRAVGVGDDGGGVARRVAHAVELVVRDHANGRLGVVGRRGRHAGELDALGGRAAPHATNHLGVARPLPVVEEGVGHGLGVAADHQGVTTRHVRGGVTAVAHRDEARLGAVHEAHQPCVGVASAGFRIDAQTRHVDGQTLDGDVVVADGGGRRLGQEVPVEEPAVVVGGQRRRTDRRPVIGHGQQSAAPADLGVGRHVERRVEQIEAVGDLQFAAADLFHGIQGVLEIGRHQLGRRAVHDGGLKVVGHEVQDRTTLRQASVEGFTDGGMHLIFQS